MRKLLLAGLVIAMIPPDPVLAQQPVRGTVYDSLRARGALLEAVVSIDGLPLVGRTDRRGRFTLEHVPPGTWTVRVRAPWLDSLSLSPVAEVVVDEGRAPRPIRVAVPSLASYQLAVCGARFDDEQGILRGEVRDASGELRPGLFVGALWSEALVTAVGTSGRTVASVDTTDAGGMFSLCGVPRGVAFLVRAGDNSLGTGDLVLDLGDRAVARADLTVGATTRTAVVRGRVIDEAGNPLSGVVVALPGDTTQGSRTGIDGSFRFDALPQRSAQLHARAIGYTPRYVTVEPTSAEVLLPDIVLGPVAQELSEVRITAEARTLAELEFRERQRLGSGIFVDENMLINYPMLSANILASLSTRVQSSGGRFPVTMLRLSGQSCRPRFFLDGVDFGRPRDGIEERDLLTRAKRVEIHDALSMPAQYYDVGNCGVVLVWTR